MQHDLRSRSSHDLDLRSNFDLEILRSNYTCFDASRRGEHDGAYIVSPSFFVQKLFAKNLMFWV